MSSAVESLKQRLATFQPGDVVEAANLIDELEMLIVADETDFDEAASLSRVLDRLQGLVKQGVDADWTEFFRLVSPDEAPPVAEESGIEVDVEVLFSFLSEAHEHLDAIEERVLSLEQNPEPRTVNEIFRSVHTVKGVAGFLNLTAIKGLAHELEFLLDELRSGTRVVDRTLVDVLLLGCDHLNDLVKAVTEAAGSLKVAKGQTQLVLPPSDETQVLAAIAALRPGPPAPAPVVVAAPTSVPPPANEVSELMASPELFAKFAQEAMEILETVERCLLTMEKTRSTGDHLHEAFRSVHTLKGNAGFFGYQALESLCMDMESLLDALRKGQRAVDGDAIEVLLASLDRLKGLVAAPGRAAEAAPPVPAPSVPITRAEVAESPPRPAEVAPEGPKAEAEFGKYTVKKKDIRVDTEKLDQLFDLIGELITTEAMVIDNPELRTLELDSFPRAAAYLGKITRELQSVTMSIRMIPLEGLFSKMHRLVRDLGRKFSKEIELEISGAETEMDRNIIEEISDPLVHIIRNAIDHGIEDGPTRAAKGKAGGGKIRLNARYEGNEIWITISDDGAGLDRDRILSVARNKGLIGDAELPEAEVWKLIFEPGFSTAKQVSEISGRGVGMDVVKKNLEKLRGQIDIHTAKDRGTDFILRIPLTLAIIDGVTLRSGSTLYSLPIADVVEFQNYQPDKVTQTDPDHRVLRLRNEVLPVLPLSELFLTQSGPSTETRIDKMVSIIVKSQGRKLALIVDEIVGYKQIVLKALPESMAGLQGISGCTILGNGEVSLIIDVNALFQRVIA